MDVRVGLWRRLSAKELMLLNCGVGEDSWESLGLQGDPTSPFWRRSVLGDFWKDWCWSWNSNTLATSCEKLTHWKRLWCWEGLGAGGEGDDRGWDAWMASLTQWMWVWVNSRNWWWTGRTGVLRFMGSQRVGHDWATELNWNDMKIYKSVIRNFIHTHTHTHTHTESTSPPKSIIYQKNRSWCMSISSFCLLTMYGWGTSSPRNETYSLSVPHLLPRKLYQFPWPHGIFLL